MFRTFIAIKIDPARNLIDLLNTCIERLNDDLVKWVEIENMHLTLKFLGNTSAEQMEEIKQYLQNDISLYSGFSFNLTGLEFFKSGGKPRVIYSGIDDYQDLEKLHAEIENKMVGLGFKKDPRKFNPHLTLGRIKFIQNKRSLIDLAEDFRDKKIQRIDVKDIIFYQSILRQEGPIYKPLVNVGLQTK